MSDRIIKGQKNHEGSSWSSFMKNFKFEENDVEKEVIFIKRMPRNIKKLEVLH